MPVGCRPLVACIAEQIPSGKKNGNANRLCGVAGCDEYVVEEAELGGVGKPHGMARPCGCGASKQRARILRKGDKVLVVGGVRYREYEDEVSSGKTKIDVKKRLAEIHASGIERLYKAEKAEAAEGGAIE